MGVQGTGGTGKKVKLSPPPPTTTTTRCALNGVDKH